MQYAGNVIQLLITLTTLAHMILRLSAWTVYFIKEERVKKGDRVKMIFYGVCLLCRYTYMSSFHYATATCFGKIKKIESNKSTCIKGERSWKTAAATVDITIVILVSKQKKQPSKL